MANVLGSLFQDIADAIRGKTGGESKLTPSQFATAISSISVSSEDGGSSGGTVVSGSGLKFATGSFSTGTTGIYRQTITHGLGVMPDLIMVYLDMVIVTSTTEETLKSMPLQCMWGLHSKFVNDVSVAGYYNIIGLAPDNSTAYLDVYKGEYQIYCPDDATFAFGTSEDSGATTGLLAEDMTYSWIAISGMGSAVSDDVRYVTFMNGDTELYVKAVATGDDCVDVLTKGLIETPTKESDAQYDYTFYGWGAEDGGAADSTILDSITENKTVYAIYTKTVRYYTITWLDDDGETVLATTSVAYGSVPSYTPVKDGYALSGWLPTLVAVTGEATYTAVWSQVLASGTCGDSAVWSLSTDYVLTISGSGATTSYLKTSSNAGASFNTRPWESYISSIKEVVIEDGISSVNTGLAASCTALQKVTMADSVTAISAHAFFGCTALTDVKLSANLKSIGGGVFRGCKKLESITIPDCVTTIYQWYAFQNCSKLASITIPSSMSSIGANTFEGCTALVNVIFENASGWVANSESLDVSDSSTAATYLTSTYLEYTWTRS